MIIFKVGFVKVTVAFNIIVLVELLLRLLLQYCIIVEVLLLCRYL